MGVCNKVYYGATYVLVCGYIHLKYFALQLSQVVVATSLFGEVSITQELLMKSFRSIVLNRCVTDNKFVSEKDRIQLRLIQPWYTEKMCKVDILIMRPPFRET